MYNLRMSPLFPSYTRNELVLQNLEAMDSNSQRPERLIPGSESRKRLAVVSMLNEMNGPWQQQ